MLIGADIEATCTAIEELEETARLALMLRGRATRGVTEDQIAGVVTKFGIEWDV